MDSVQTTTLGPCYISRLPNEMLYEILKHATHLSYEVEPERISGLYNSWSAEKFRTREYYAHMKFKLDTIKLVSKQWYDVSTPFQLEWVIVGLNHWPRLIPWGEVYNLVKSNFLPVHKSPTRYAETWYLGNLSSLFFNRALGIYNSRQPATWWTKRFDIVLRSVPLHLALLDNLAQLISLFPNIEILTLIVGLPPGRLEYTLLGDDFYGTSWDLSMSHLLHSIPNTVKVISLEGFPILAHTWTEFLATHPNITTINPPLVITHDTIHKTSTEVDQSLPSLSHLKHLVTYYSANDLSTLVKIVERLTVKLEGYGSHYNYHLKRLPNTTYSISNGLSSSFFQHKSLQSTKIRPRTLHIVTNSLDFLKSSYYPRLFEACEGLENLEISIKCPTSHGRIHVPKYGSWANEFWVKFQDAASILTSLKYLGIRMNLSSHLQYVLQSESLFAMQVLTVLTRWNVPGVEPVVLQFLDELSVDPILATSSPILKYSPALRSSWIMPDGTKMDITELEDEDLRQLERKAQRRMHDRVFLQSSKSIDDSKFSI